MPSFLLDAVNFLVVKLKHNYAKMVLFSLICAHVVYVVARPRRRKRRKSSAFLAAFLNGNLYERDIYARPVDEWSDQDVKTCSDEVGGVTSFFHRRLAIHLGVSTVETVKCE